MILGFPRNSNVTRHIRSHGGHVDDGLGRHDSCYHFHLRLVSVELKALAARSLRWQIRNPPEIETASNRLIMMHSRQAFSCALPQFTVAESSPLT